MIWSAFVVSTNMLAGSLLALCVPICFVASDIYFRPKKLLTYAPQASALPEPELVPCLDILFRYWRPKFYQKFMDKYQRNLFNKYYEEALYAATHDTFTINHLLDMLRVRPDNRNAVLNVLESLLQSKAESLEERVKQRDVEYATTTTTRSVIELAKQNLPPETDISFLEEFLDNHSGKLSQLVKEASVETACIENIKKAIDNAHNGDMSDTEAYIEGLLPEKSPPI